MENYNQFLNRINSFELPSLSLGNNFMPNKSVLLKVDENNNFSKFYGDTVVFDLDNTEKAVIESIIKKLYTEVPECFCNVIKTDTLHMTLHDLSNSPNFNAIANDIKNNQQRLSTIISTNPVPQQKIKMQSKAVFNMVNTSIVVGLYPTDEKEYNKLMNLYYMIDNIIAIPYPLTPHVTLAYYNRNGFDNNSARMLEYTVNKLNTCSFEINLDTSRLFYKHFSNMNDYETIFCLN